ncbi:ATP-binding protein [Luteimonas sp. MC1825]|uniref:two-component system sensor histidine kinase NtrB n=1 Tax=Luteimonas sp. MC1825 TaxID=2761107 RepID=UPI0016104C95|nr:ATP-binding protein [Luteimonas sp. MC1825]MBB6598117.1 PAS domain-containing sensor histidine kinase [Luteimonas sp. MC1825]QOC88351.1 PAS domain-containing sensor histidine kinase [Luteimonas sp. MC1825]
MTGLNPAHDTLATPLLLADAEGVVLAGNRACAQWLGVGAKRLPGLPLAALEHGDDRLQRALHAHGPGETVRLPRMPLAFPGAAAHFADAWLTARDDGGWLLEAHPVDEFGGGDPVAALPSALSAALRGLAHELRNPLAGLKGAAQLLARRVGDDADSRELVALMESEVGRLTQLIDQLLQPVPPRAHAPLNIHAVLERVLRLAENDAGWAVKLVRDYDPSLPELDGDPDRLTQAVWNLVRNAIEAGAGAVVLRTRAEHGLRIGGEPHALALRLEIVDDGRGVPEALAEQVFLPLVSGRAEGTGLGLALAQQVAREHRGSIAYRSRAGHTVFTLLLPYPPPTDVARDAGSGGERDQGNAAEIVHDRR